MNVYKCFRWEDKGNDGRYFTLPIEIDGHFLNNLDVLPSMWYLNFYYIVHPQYNLNDDYFFTILDKIYDYIILQYEPGGSEFLKSQKSIESSLRVFPTL